MDRKEQLTQQAAQIDGDIRAKQAAIANENRTATDEEIGEIAGLDKQFNSIRAEIEQLQATEARAAVLSHAQPRIVDSAPNAPAAAAPVQRAPIKGGTLVAHNFANHGFDKGFGEFLMSVRSSFAYAKHDPRLMVNAVTTWAGETVGADGGFALPPAFFQGIMSLVNSPDSFVRAMNPFPTQSDIITVPKDEDAPWSSTTGVQAGKTAEGAAITASKVAVGQLKVPMYGIKSLVHVDEKSLRDMAFLAAYVERKMGEKIRWKVENYVVNGSGENEPLGILNAPGLKSITAADGSSTSTTLSAFDVGLMEASALQGAGGFWVAHPLIKAQVRSLANGSAGFPLFQSDWRSGATVDTLLGYPYYSSPACKAYGTPGDIIFVKPDGYLLAFEQSGVQNATTIAFAFDQNLQSFRSTLYMGGAPTLSSVVTLPDGSTTQSNLIVLAGSRS